MNITLFLIVLIIGVICLFSLLIILKNGAKSPLIVIRILGIITISCIGFIAYTIGSNSIKDSKENELLLTQAFSTIEDIDSVKIINWTDENEPYKNFDEPLKLSEEQTKELLTRLKNYEQTQGNGRWEFSKQKIDLELYNGETIILMTLKHNDWSTLIQFNHPVQTKTGVHDVIAIDGLGEWLEKELLTN